MALYVIQFSIYSIIAVLIFCWYVFADSSAPVLANIVLVRSVALLKGVYNLKFKRLAKWHTLISIGSKVFALVVPPFLIGLSFLPSIQRSAAATLAMNIILSESPQSRGDG